MSPVYFATIAHNGLHLLLLNLRTGLLRNNDLLFYSCVDNQLMLKNKSDYVHTDNLCISG
jgi:hypothetical protein